MLKLRRDGKAYNKLIHRLVAHAFIGLCPNAFTVDHRDFDKLNNKATNLRYKTNKENIQLAFAAGIYPSGSKRWNAKLDEVKVKEIKQRLRDGESVYKLGAAFGVCHQNIHMIKQGKTGLM